LEELQELAKTQANTGLVEFEITRYIAERFLLIANERVATFQSENKVDCRFTKPVIERTVLAFEGNNKDSLLEGLGNICRSRETTSETVGMGSSNRFTDEDFLQ